MDSDTRRQLLADIASLYYLEKKTQAEIAMMSGYSRSAISRMLTEAESLGIIEINIKYPSLRVADLERRLKEKYSLEAAFVINSGQMEYEHNLNQVGRLGALYLQKIVADGMVIGIGWGSSLFELVSSLTFRTLENVQIAQVIGASGGKSDIRVDGPDLAVLLASKLNATHHFLHSPLYLEDEATCRSLKEQKQIKDTLELAYKSNIVLLGIGTIEVDPLYSSIFRSGFLGKDEILEVKRQGGVGNFCGVILDKNGNILDIEVNHRTMAVDLNRLRKNENKLLGIAAGKNKTKAINAVLRGKWLDILVTDSNAAVPLLEN